MYGLTSYGAAMHGLTSYGAAMHGLTIAGQFGTNNNIYNNNIYNINNININSINIGEKSIKDQKKLRHIILCYKFNCKLRFICLTTAF